MRKRVMIKARYFAQVILTKQEWLFVTLALVFGIIMVFAMPLFTPPDESAHFLRGYEISQGGFIGKTIGGNTGDYIPTELSVCSSVTSKCGDKTVDFKEKTFTTFSSSAYSPVVYIPQAIGIAIGRVVHPSVLTMAVFGRVFNLLAYIAMLFIAIRIAKMGKWVYVVIGLFPVAIQQAASLSGDVMTVGLCMIWIALLANLYVTKQRINTKYCVALILLAIGLALTKQTNLLLLASLLVLPMTAFRDRWHKLRTLLLIILSAVVAFAVWSLVLKSIHYNFSYPIASSDTYGPLLQLKSMVHSPQLFVTALFHQYVFEGFHNVSGVSPDFLVVSMHSYFSSFVYKLPLVFCILGYVGLAVAFLYKEKSERLLSDKGVRTSAILQSAIFVVSLVAIAGALYLTWTPVGSMVVYGIQGRYFIPLVPLLIPLFILIKKYVSIETRGKYTIGILLGSISFINLLLTVILTYKYFSL